MNVRGLWFAVIASGLAFCIGGCGRAKAPAATNESTGPDAIATTNADPAAPQVAVPVAPVVVEQNANVDAVLGQLTEAVRKYGFEKRRMPKTVEEVVAAGYVAGMPPAPAGKKFAIDAKSVQVVLVNQ